MSRQPSAIPGADATDQRAWRAFLGAHATLTRRLDADLVARHGLTLSDYDVLLQLAWADGRLRPSELADRVLLTRAGITRLLAGLEKAGHIARERCEEDRRVSYAVLTAAGRSRLRAASRTHLEGIEETFSSRFSERELERLAVLLERLTGPER